MIGKTYPLEEMSALEQQRPFRRIVVKVGTSTLTRETGSLNLHNMEHLARVLSDLEGM